MLWSSIKPLLAMWLYPRMVAWFILAAAVGLAARLPFVRVPLIPHFLDFNPGVAWVPLSGVFWGPAGAWGAVVASLAGDRLLGLWSPLSPYRAVGVFLFALAAQRLWEVRGPADGVPQVIPGWGRTLRFMMVMWPGCFVAATWPAWAAEATRCYPFTYVASVLLAHHLLFCAALGPVVYRVFARELVPSFGTWRDVMASAEETKLAHRGASLLSLGALGSWLIGLAYSGLFYGHWPWQRFHLGDHTSRFIVWASGAFLVLQVLGLLVTKPCARSAGVSKFAA